MPGAAALRHVRFAGIPTPNPLALSSLRSEPGGPGRGGVCPRETRATGGASPDAFPAWVLARAGLAPGAYRGYCLDRRVAACLRQLRARAPEDARRILDDDPSRLPGAVSSLLIGTTGFFRDAEVFAVLRERVVPALASRADPIRVWSAGCSSGEELCSIGLLLAGVGRLSSAHLLGTDCRSDAIHLARARLAAGTGNPRASANAPARSIACVGAWTPLAPADEAGELGLVAQRARWKVADLLCGVEAGPWDLILWRNVAIYLTLGAAADVYARLAEVLRPGGYLVVGKAERPPAGLGLEAAARCIYRRTGGTDAAE